MVQDMVQKWYRQMMMLLVIYVYIKYIYNIK